MRLREMTAGNRAWVRAVADEFGDNDEHTNLAWLLVDGGCSSHCRTELEKSNPLSSRGVSLLGGPSCGDLGHLHGVKSETRTHYQVEG